MPCQRQAAAQLVCSPCLPQWVCSAWWLACARLPGSRLPSLARAAQAAGGESGGLAPAAPHGPGRPRRSTRLLLGLERREERRQGRLRLGRVVRRRHDDHAGRAADNLHQLLHAHTGRRFWGRRAGTVIQRAVRGYLVHHSLHLTRRSTRRARASCQGTATACPARIHVRKGVSKYSRPLPETTSCTRDTYAAPDKQTPSAHVCPRGSLSSRATWRQPRRARAPRADLRVGGEQVHHVGRDARLGDAPRERLAEPVAEAVIARVQDRHARGRLADRLTPALVPARSSGPRRAIRAPPCARARPVSAMQALFTLPLFLTPDAERSPAAAATPEPHRSATVHIWPPAPQHGGLAAGPAQARAPLDQLVQVEPQHGPVARRDGRVRQVLHLPQRGQHGARVGPPAGAARQGS